METRVIKTEKILPYDKDIFSVLDKHLESFGENAILAITSKIISICEGRVVKIGKIDKKQLVERESEYFLPPKESKYNITLTIKNGLLVPAAGIDESNGNGYYILWPADPQKTANDVRRYLCERFSVKRAGVIITDSKTMPLRTGTTGLAIAHSGFLALKDYVGKPDIFGRKLRVTKSNLLDALAAAAALMMGEGNEQTPLALIKDVPFIEFQQRNPTDAELEELKIGMRDDLYAPLLKNIKWKKGYSKRHKI